MNQNRKNISVKNSEFVMAGFDKLVAILAVISIMVGMAATKGHNIYAGGLVLYDIIHGLIPLLYYTCRCRFFQGRPKSWGAKMRYEKQLKVWESYSSVKYATSVIVSEIIVILLFSLSFSSQRGSYGKINEAGVIIAYLAIPVILLIVIIAAKFLYFMSIQNTLTLLKKKKFSEVCDKDDIVWVESDCGFDCSEELFFEEKGLFLGNAYIMDEALFKRIFAKESLEAAKSRVTALCFFTQTESKELLTAQIDELIRKYIGEGRRGIKTIVIVNRRKADSLPLIQNEYDKHEYITYMERPDFDDITPTLVYSFFKKQANTHEKNEIPGIVNIRHYFNAPNEFLEKINVDNQFDMRLPQNKWIGDFYSNAIVFVNCSRSVMALLDYQELILRLAAIYYYKKDEVSDVPVNIKAPIGGTFTTIAEDIIRASIQDEERYNKLTGMFYKKNQFVDVYFNHLKEFLYVRFEGDKVSFAGIVSMVKKLRDKFIAHGNLNHENSVVLWGLLFWATVVLNNYLDMADFKLQQNGNEFMIGYGDDLLSAGDLIWNDNGSPCIILKENKGKKTYVNYFDGSLVVPEYIEKI